MDENILEERCRPWRELLEQRLSSGLSRAAFCRDRNLSLDKMRYWEKRIRELDGEDTEGFAQVTTPGSGIRLVLPGGLRVEVDPCFDEATMQRFLKVAAAAC